MMILAALFILFTRFPVSSTYDRNVYSAQVAWKIDLFLISCALYPMPTVVASPPPEEVAKLKDKIQKGKDLIEDLSDLLIDIKDAMKKGKSVEKTKLNKINDIKERFQKLQVDSGDLPKELLEKFRERTLEAFKLMLESFNYGEVPLIKMLEETKDFDESSQKLAKRFAEEL